VSLLARAFRVYQHPEDEPTSGVSRPRVCNHADGRGGGMV